MIVMTRIRAPTSAPRVDDLRMLFLGCHKGAAPQPRVASVPARAPMAEATGHNTNPAPSSGKPMLSTALET